MDSYGAVVDQKMEFEQLETKLYEMDLLQLSSNAYHVIHNARSKKVKVESILGHPKEYWVWVNGHRHHIKLTDAMDRLIDGMGFATGSAKDVQAVLAPMPGLILDIAVSPGQVVEENDTLLVLEAMKMENVITAPKSGTIAAVHGVKGQAVDKNFVLVEFEK